VHLFFRLLVFAFVPLRLFYRLRSTALTRDPATDSLHTSNVERSYGSPLTRQTRVDILDPMLHASQPGTAKSILNVLSVGYFSRTLLNFVCQVDEVINESLIPITFRRTVDNAA
jgi:hypothetical protein